MRHSSSALLALPSRARSSPSSPVLSCSLEETFLEVDPLYPDLY